MPLGGLTLTGFIAPTVEEIVTDINAKVLARVDAGLDLAPDQPIGQLIGIVAEEKAEIWELMATVYNAMNPDAAEGQLLDNISAISGTRRRSAKFSTVIANLNLNSSVTVPAGSVASVSGQPTNRWVLTADVTNSSGSAATIPGTFRSQNPGPFVANAGTLTVIETPVIGWNSVTNPADAIEGIPQDTDASLRILRENELAATGSANIDAVRARVLEVAGVLQCFVFENTSLVTDGTGLPGKSYRVVVWDGPSLSASNTDIAQAIWNTKASGIQTFGATQANAVDSQGITRVVYFDRAQQIPIYLSYTTTPGSLTTAQTQAVKDAAAAYALAHQNLNVEVVALAYQAIPLSIAGIIDVPLLHLGIAPSPTGTANIPISGLQIATLSTTNILVNGI